jgi:putative salt-induced outer membrane protein YdiY
MKNGDKITGEIKKLVNGDLHVDPSYGENIFIIDWNEVERIEGNNQFIAQTIDGKSVTATVESDPQQAGKLLVDDGFGPIKIDQSEMVFLKPVNEGFWGRLSTSVDFGMSLTKANDTKQLNSRLTAGYLTDKWEASAMFDTLLNSREGVENTRRTEYGGDYRYIISGRWFAIGTGKFLQSDELQLKLRSTVGGGAGNYIVRNNRWIFSAMSGVAWTNENYRDPDLDNVNNGEMFASVEVNAFDIGDIDILTSFSMAPSLTDSGRVRLDFRSDVQWEIFKDFYFRVGFTDNYDNRPVGDAPKNDYVFSTSVGWSY